MSLIFWFFACVPQEYSIMDLCTSASTGAADLMFCHRQVVYPEAAEVCFTNGGDLVDVTVDGPTALEWVDLDELELVSLAGYLELGDSWWGGWPSYEAYKCPLMTASGISTPRECEEEHPFICEVPN